MEIPATATGEVDALKVENRRSPLADNMNLERTIHGFANGLVRTIVSGVEAFGNACFVASESFCSRGGGVLDRAASLEDLRAVASFV